MLHLRLVQIVSDTESKHAVVASQLNERTEELAAVRTEVEALRARLVEAEAGLEKAAASLAEKQSALDETKAARQPDLRWRPSGE